MDEKTPVRLLPDRQIVKAMLPQKTQGALAKMKSFASTLLVLRSTIAKSGAPPLVLP